MKAQWNKLNVISLEDLSITRQMVHQAVQLPAIAGRCLNPKDPDDKTAALTWLEKRRLLAGRFWKGNKHRAALNISGLELILLDEQSTVLRRYPVNGKTYGEAFDWLSEQAYLLGYGSDNLSNELPYQIPYYKYADDLPFEITNEQFLTELENYFANASLALNEARDKNNASEVLCWPHHFDIATIISVENSSDPEKSKSIGVGMSPGDESYNEPYYYVSPWPYPEDKKSLPELQAGTWHIEGWFGAVLTSTEITAFIDANDQLKVVRDFINSATIAAKNML